jgi:hypothetical protein
MQERRTSTIKCWLRGFTSLPRIIKKYPVSFAVLCVKALLSVIATVSGDFMGITREATVWSGYYFGSYTAWVLLFRLSYFFWLVLPINHPYLGNFPNELFFNPTPSISLLFFFLKLPIIVADVLSGLLIYKIVLMRSNSHKTAYKTFRVWFYNPIITLLAEMFGSIDVVAAMLVLACIYYFMRNRLVLSSVFLLVGIAFRTYPLLILPILLIILCRREERRIKDIGIFITFTVLPLIALFMFLTLVTNGAFLEAVSFGQVEYPYFLGPLLYFSFIENITQAEPISVTIALFILVLFVIYDHEKEAGNDRKNFRGDNNVTSYVFMLLLALFAFSYWNPQFLLWILPFATLDYGLKKSSMKLLLTYQGLSTLCMTMFSLAIYDPEYPVKVRTCFSNSFLRGETSSKLC